MTHEKWIPLTPEQRRIKVAELDGRMKWSYALPQPCIHCDVPDYLNNPNDMIEALKSLSDLQKFDFVYALNDTLGLVPLDSPASIREPVLFAFATATAAQLAEAFVLTMEPEDENNP